MAITEFRSNKLRTFLSLLGITFGIFCIISVLATINGMKTAVQNDIKALGSNTVFIDKWEYMNSNDYPWWRFVKRPSPKYEEVAQLKDRVSIIQNATFLTQDNSVVEFENDILSGINYYGAGEDFAKIEHFGIGEGRYLQQTDFDRGTNSLVVGYNIAEKLFSKPELAIGKTVRLKSGKPAVIIGVIEKQGQSMMDMWGYDDCVIMPYKFLRQLTRDEDANPKIIVEGKENISIPALKEELTGAMRSIHKLSPGQEDDYALNDIESFSREMDKIFSNINKGGWAIAALSLIVGMFGVANIMFVTVRERTGQIGLKKALGAKRRTIVSEFLLESSFLCIIGGMIGLIGVFILAVIVSSFLSFKVFIPVEIIGMAVGICLFVGIVAGIIPAVTAAKMDPVVAIRSTT
ncbi:MAG: ABC transporter permease [Bacteroidota bacterium]|nr:ABC transporter permease [Bacteroidota bacterium]MDP4213908.1 ABC transporter permease [Bacteroidota bacterium]MDP4249518.1 ABC transporter permease [Bacteroidota bacterium]